jgi:hypothetical protein
MAGTTIAQTDQGVQREVQLELKWDARVSPNEIGVAVKDGVVTLSGTVDNYTRKWSAERAALRVRGLQRWREGQVELVQIRQVETDTERGRVLRDVRPRSGLGGDVPHHRNDHWRAS